MSRKTKRYHQALILKSVQRLASAGFLDGATVFVDDDLFEVAPEYKQLVLAGRNPTTEAAFVDAWMTGDPRRVTTWIETEAANLAQKRRRDGLC